MATFILDTLAYSDTLKAGGFSEQQATTQARALAEILDRQMATKTEIAEHENNLRRDIRESELRLEAKLAETNSRIAETNARIAESKAELTRWVIGAGFFQTTVIVAVLMKVAKLL
jgi:septal ring factor EnvC (AmiA/AmiB activator)